MRHFHRPCSPWILLCTCVFGTLALTGCQGTQSETAGQAVAPPTAEHYRAFQRADRLAAYLRSSPNPLVSAHRGGPDAGFPENALQTFGHALTQGPVLLEIDVRMTKDSVLVLMHDDTLTRTTTGRGAVQAQTLKEIRSVQLVTNTGTPTRFEVPTLSEALAWAEGRAVLQLDIKEHVPRSRVAAALQRQDALDQALVITYTLEDAKWYHQRLPDLVLSASAETREDASALVQRIDPSRLLGWVGIGEVADGPAEVFSENGVPIAVGTFGETDRQARNQGLIVYHRLFNQGVDVVSTNEPALASQAAATYAP
ncbi:glycerophosphodiester phosphodiesterase family protein [Salinibacter altiplanensis]|uniref:glycerophosphodiester phosphodiesterase family protein n=1 Tax=Salinibacter altiplanensis TaxID=1803181 RepID=UPI000C9F7B45|nr:glycerophosphodiester phosphodiesterase family protein [Salinibacter altiplanensis]